MPKTIETDPETIKETASPVKLTPLLTIEDLSIFFGMAVGTIYNWVSKGYGPTPCRIGGKLRWRLEDVTAWVAAQELEMVA